MRRIALVISVLALVAVTLVASGCATIAQKATEAAVEKTTGVKVDENAGTVSATDKEGNKIEVSSNQGTYPEGFPADFPKVSGQVESGVKGTSNGKDGFTVTIKSADAPKKLFDFYVAELEKSGWKIDQKMDGTTSDSAFATITCSKGDLKGGITLSRNKGESETAIVVILGSESQ